MNWWTVVKFGVLQAKDVLLALLSRNPQPEPADNIPDPTSIGVAMSSGAAASREGKLAAEKAKADDSRLAEKL